MSDEGYKIVGELNDETGAGVFGHNTATSGDAIGVEGKTESGEGYGLYTDENAHVGGTLESASKSPNIVVYEDGGTSRAVTESTSYTGAGIFAAAQQAINARIDTDGGNVDVFIKPGEYDLTRGLVVDEPGAERIRIGSPGLAQVTLNAGDIDSSIFDSAIEINPGPVGDGEAGDRLTAVMIDGLRLNDTARDTREINGIYINDSNYVAVTDCLLWDGFKRGLWLRNCWQGRVDSVEVTYCGSSAASTPGIQVGHYDDTATYQALNHIQLNHLQGQVDEYAYLETRGTVTRLDISFPNVEFLELPGFVFDASHGRMRGQIRGAQLSGGAPAIEVKDGARIEIVGGQLAADTTAVNASGTGVPKVIIGGGITLDGGDGNPVIDATNSRLNVSGFRLRSGERGIVADGCSMVNVSNGTIRDVDGAGVWGRNLSSGPYVVSDLNLVGVSGDSETPIYLENADDVTVTGISAEPDREVSVVRLGDCDNTTIRAITPAGPATDAYRVDSASSFRHAKGTTTVEDGSTTVSVAHGLSESPDYEDISVTPAGPLGSASSWYLSSVAPDTFEITVDADPGRDVPFAWNATL